MRLTIGNAYAELRDAPGPFRDALSRHLAVPLGSRPEQQKLGTRFGFLFNHDGSPYGSLVHDHGRRVASGLVPYVEALARHYGYSMFVEDYRQKPADAMPLWAPPLGNVPWRSYQDSVHQQIMRYDRGVVDAPPRSGKTLMAARAIDALGQPTIYIAPSVAIVDQTYKVLTEIFGSEWTARIDGDATPEQRDPSKLIVVATAQSAIALGQDFFATRRLLVIDEFHHAASESYHAINALSEWIYYRLCFTGTHFRTGDDALAMHAVCSVVLHAITYESLVAGGYLAPARVIFSPVRARSGMPSDKGTWLEVYDKDIVECEKRNNAVAQIARTMTENLIPTLVLTRRREHAKLLSAMIPQSQVVLGGEGALTSRSISEFNAGKLPVLVGTQVIGEGVDVPRAGALVYACGGNEGVQQMQSYFRPLTAFPGKTTGLIYDFLDGHHPMLARQADTRMRIAREILGQHCLVDLSMRRYAA